MPAHNPTQLSDIIRGEMAANGNLTFAKFMELALYHHPLGYYAKRTNSIGARGDFITSVCVGPLLGQLLAVQFMAWLKPLASSGVQIIEAGAHTGQLAVDILTAWDELGGGDVAYGIVEPSANRRESQRNTLAAFPHQTRWFDDWADIPAHSVPGIIFANELLDAFPLHRYGWDAAKQAWFEWGVGWENDRFVWRPLPERSRLMDLVQGHSPHVLPGVMELVNLANRLWTVLPDGFTLEINRAAESWWHEAATRLNNGYLMTLDYGLEAEDFFRPECPAGTLRAYRAHRHSPDCLDQPGEQDLTAAVNFSALRLAGETAGLKTVVFETQARFLMAIAKTTWQKNSSTLAWNMPMIKQFKTLIHPEHFGRAFKVFVQANVKLPA